MKLFNNAKWIGALVLSASIGYGSIAVAQTAEPEAKAQHRREHMQKLEKHLKKDVKITNDQEAQIKAIREQNKAKLQADRLAIKNAADKDARKAAIQQYKADRKAMKEQIKAILTAEQIAKLEKAQEKRQAEKAKHEAEKAKHEAEKAKHEAEKAQRKALHDKKKG